MIDQGQVGAERGGRSGRGRPSPSSTTAQVGLRRYQGAEVAAGVAQRDRGPYKDIKR